MINNDENRRVLKGGSFLDLRDGYIDSDNEDEQQNLKIRISARLGRSKTYTAQNVGFRCAQSIRKDEENYEFQNGETHRVFRLRAPIHHHLDAKNSHPVHRETEKTEL